MAKAQKLSQALSQLQKTPDDPSAQGEYLEGFPQNYKDFLELFDLGRPLYDDSYEYVEAVSSLAKNHEAEVGKLLVELSKDAHYEADAPGYLRNAMAAYGSQYTKTFLARLKSLPAAKQANLITFVADVEAFDAYPEYQLIIDHAKALGETQLAKKFELARAKRSKQPHR
jgi:hypothetical protein